MAPARIPDPDPPHLRPTRFSHLVLKTDRFAEMIAWYRTFLRAKPLFENDVVCFLTYDEEHHRLMIGRHPGAKARDPDTAGVVHWAYAFESLGQLVDAHARLAGEGILPAACINHGFTTSYYYRDPDGNEVELAVDNYETRDAMNAWFATGAFDRNFVGVPVDPDDITKRHREGEPAATILQGSYA